MRGAISDLGKSLDSPVFPHAAPVPGTIRHAITLTRSVVPLCRTLCFNRNFVSEEHHVKPEILESKDSYRGRRGFNRMLRLVKTFVDSECRRVTRWVSILQACLAKDIQQSG